MCFSLAAVQPVCAQQMKESTTKKNNMDNPKTEGFNEAERHIILSGGKDSKLHVYQTTDEDELRILKNISSKIDYTDALLPILEKRMLLTVQDPTHSGVGIAAPQVGINKSAIWVQRLDKQDDPFEFYINPKITWRSQLQRLGAEGCLSIPDRKEEVRRSYAIQIQYQDKMGKQVTEIVEGFTAVIFQHEIDHLQGILFPDRLDEQTEANYIELNEKIPFAIQSQKKMLLP